MYGDFVTRQIVIDEEATSGIDCQFFHEGCTSAHGHGTDDLVSGGFGVQNAACGADGQHPADTDFAGKSIDTDFDKMACKGGLLVSFVYVSIFNGVLGNQFTLMCSLSKGENTVTDMDISA